jgi:hypothetical protein
MEFILAGTLEHKGDVVPACSGDESCSDCALLDLRIAIADGPRLDAALAELEKIVTSSGELGLLRRCQPMPIAEAAPHVPATSVIVRAFGRLAEYAIENLEVGSTVVIVGHPNGGRNRIKPDKIYKLERCDDGTV